VPEEYAFNRRAGCCAACNRGFQRGEEHFSALRPEPPPPPPPPAASRRKSAAAAAATAAAAASAGGAPDQAPGAGAPAAGVEADGPKPSKLPWRRVDFCAGCWKPEQSGDYFSFWKTTVPDEDPDKDKPLARRIDAETVYEMFRRLEGQPDPEKQKFRFILALILMRRKRLRFSGVASGPQGEHLVLEDRAENVTHKVLDPGLADEEIDSLKGAVDRLLRGSAPGPGEGDPAQ
jgi:hypothetical protein